ncbi:MAG: hypothetical protein Q7K40_04635, partial [bacterium]|nr:hypothetical protein [bacterium]
LQNVNASKENLPDDVSTLLPSMQGIQAEESAYLDDDKVIYVSRPNDQNEKTSRRKIADNVEHVFDQQGSKILFAKSLVIQDEVGGTADLWAINTQTGKEKKIADSVGDAVLSPSGELIATSNLVTGGIDLLTGDGVFLKKIGIYGALPLFSPDNKQIAYYKFASSSFDRDLPGNTIGIVIYDLNTEEEIIVTNDSKDNNPIAFSADGKKLYFNSLRTSTQSLWVVDLSSNAVKQLSNKSSIGSSLGGLDPLMNRNLLVSSDGLQMISLSYEDEIGMLVFKRNGEVESSKTLGKGSNLQWLAKDSVVAYRAQGFKGKYWEFVSVK